MFSSPRRPSAFLPPGRIDEPQPGGNGAAASEGIYALSVSGSGFAYGTDPDLADTMEFTDDISGSAEYKKYLAKIVFTLGR